tara:strand:- start:4859 stop:5320 length:462 start_codon:yes stop_codon:yes gene_type:complete
MARRKNTKRIDPRYFMDEKTDIIKEAWEPKSYNRGTRDKEDPYINRGPPPDKESETLADRTRRRDRERREREREEAGFGKAKSKYFEENDKAGDVEVMIPGYGSMMVGQVKRKLAEMLQEAAEDAAQDPPQYSHLDGGVIQALHQALKENEEI